MFGLFKKKNYYITKKNEWEHTFQIDCSSMKVKQNLNEYMDKSVLHKLLVVRGANELQFWKLTQTIEELK
jgi:hypothetical protein